MSMQNTDKINQNKKGKKGKKQTSKQTNKPKNERTKWKYQNHIG